MTKGIWGHERNLFQVEAHTSRWEVKEIVKVWVNLTHIVLFLTYLNMYWFLMWIWKTNIMDYVKYLEVEYIKGLHYNSNGKESPAMRETKVQSLGQEDPLEKGMAIHSSILAWRTPWTEKPGKLQFMGSQRVRQDWVTNTHTHTHPYTHTQYV